MVMKLEKVVPFGRSFTEYQQMFSLDQSDLNKKIIAIADGPASFNFEATEKGSQIISVDPIYQLEGEIIKQKFYAVVDDIINQIKATPDDWIWSYHHDPETLRKHRETVLELFLQDYEKGKQEKRYQYGILPQLNYPDQEFQLALCSHFLFLYSGHYDYEFHLNSIQEMLRISQEVRIFPLITMMLNYSPYLQNIIDHFTNLGYNVFIKKVAYQLQKGGDEMLQIITPK
jgi:hypothetical protein